MNIKQPPLIAIVAYNRSSSLERLLNSLLNANYTINNIPLIISIDRHPDNVDVLKIANEFIWPHGEKKVTYQEENLGLREHIIKTGKLSYEYGSIIMLEDDLFVAPGFYDYAIQALNYSKDKKYIGGISLFNYQYNPLTSFNFNVNEDGYDNYYFQYASSWGQAWTSDQFKEFIEWLDKNPSLTGRLEIPQYVRSWSDKSWLKYHIAFLVEKNKYFLYPKIALSTNFNDVGTHVGNSSTTHQVPLLSLKSKKYNFSELNDSKATYNSFFENEHLFKFLGYSKKDLHIDLTGYNKNYNQKKYILTTSIYNFKIINIFGRSLKPIESNIFNNIKGNEIYLYDTSNVEKNNFKKNTVNDIIYSIKHITLPNSRIIFIWALKTRMLGYYGKVKELINL
jgi:hypothetical protein